MMRPKHLFGNWWDYPDGGLVVGRLTKFDKHALMSLLLDYHYSLKASDSYMDQLENRIEELEGKVYSLEEHQDGKERLSQSA